MKIESRDTRLRRAAASILENEALTEGLDDAGAEILLDWIMTDVERIVAATDGIADDHAAQSAIEADLKALRKFMRCIPAWIAAGVGSESEAARSAAADAADVADGLVHDAAGLLEAMRIAQKNSGVGR